MEFDSHSWVLWVGVIATVLHVLEEHAMGWVSWANHEIGPRLGIEFTETDFMLTNVALVFIALAGAAIGWWAPAISLAVPALFIINAVVFHMLPSARAERLTPGTISAVFIYLPVAAWIFWAAGDDGHLNFGTFLLSFIIGAALMAWPIAVLYLKGRIGWDDEYVAVAATAREARLERETRNRAAAEKAASEAVAKDKAARDAAAAQAEEESARETEAWDAANDETVSHEETVSLEDEDSAIDLAEDAGVEGHEPEMLESVDDDEEDETTVMRRD